MAAASAKRIKIVLDGVFNHTSSDSAYFDRYSRWNFLDELNPGNQSSGPGRQHLGLRKPQFARGAPGSSSRTRGSPATGVEDRCDPTDTDDRGGAWTQTYTAWYGYGSLPKLNPANQGVRDLVYAKGSHARAAFHRARTGFSRARTAGGSTSAATSTPA